MIDLIPNGNGTFSVANLLDASGRLVQLPAGRRWRSGAFYDSVVIPATILSTVNGLDAQVAFFNNDSATGTNLMTNRTGNESIPKNAMIIADSFFVHVDTHYGNQRASGDDIAGLLAAMHVSVKLGTDDVLIDELAVMLGSGGLGLSGSDFSGAGAAILTNGAANQAARRVFDIPILLSGDCDSIVGKLSFKSPQTNSRYNGNNGPVFTAYTPSVPLRVLLGFRGVISF